MSAEINAGTMTRPRDRKGEKSAPAAACPEGWTDLGKDPYSTGGKDWCVKIRAPLAAVSWTKLQYICDSQGGHLPEIDNMNKGRIELLLRSYEQIYGGIFHIYLGATDLTHAGKWKWQNSKDSLMRGNVTNWAAGTVPNPEENKDCLSQRSSDLKWVPVDCEDDSTLVDNKIANICLMEKKAVKKAEQKGSGSVTGTGGGSVTGTGGGSVTGTEDD